jgi:hypothetical protein
MKKIVSIILAVLLLILIIVYCEYDHGIAPLPGTVEATIIFRNEPPEDTEGIYLVVAPKFPPHAINELFHSPNSLPTDQDTVVTTMELPYGHYEAVSLWFYSTRTESNLADILAIPLDPENNYLPLNFDITKEEPVFKTKMYANWQRVNRDAAIEGTIYFNGPFPENTLITAIIAYLYEPEESIEFLLWMRSIDFSIDDNPYQYRLPVRHGTIRHLAVYWLAEHAALTDFQVVGFYEDPNNPGQSGELRISAGETISNIDINADWSLIKP